MGVRVRCVFSYQSVEDRVFVYPSATHFHDDPDGSLSVWRGDDLIAVFGKGHWSMVEMFDNA